MSLLSFKFRFVYFRNDRINIAYKQQENALAIISENVSFGLVWPARIWSAQKGTFFEARQNLLLLFIRYETKESIILVNAKCFLNKRDKLYVYIGMLGVIFVETSRWSDDQSFVIGSPRHLDKYDTSGMYSLHIYIHYIISWQRRFFYFFLEDYFLRL